MKKVSVLLLTLCAGAFAQSDTVVHWRGIEGVITAPGVDNPVGQVHSGAGPWTTKAGSARINLNSGEGSFEVEGLVLNGGTSSGTPGGVKSVVGTLVCNPGNTGGALRRPSIRRSRISAPMAMPSFPSSSPFRWYVTIRCF